MVINFNSSPLTDLLIVSAGDKNGLKEALVTKQMQTSPLIGDARDDALGKLKDAYDKHKLNLEKNLKYGNFLKNVERNISKFNDPILSSGMRHDVASKLSELANKHITQKEDHFSVVHKFFHKIGQLFNGHGFRTKGEWGLKLADRINTTADQTFKSKIENCIFHPFIIKSNEKRPEDILNQMKDEINDLSEADFKGVLEILFDKDEGTRFGKKYTLIFYENLTPAKQKTFNEILLLKKNWFEKAFDIIEGSEPNELHQFISEAMVLKFQAESEKVIQQYNNKHLQTVDFKKFFQALAKEAILNYLENDSYLEIAMLLQALPGSDRKIILQMLTREEDEKLRRNIDALALI